MTLYHCRLINFHQRKLHRLLSSLRLSSSLPGVVWCGVVWSGRSYAASCTGGANSGGGVYAAAVNPSHCMQQQQLSDALSHVR
jgi:hypothetical protein